jgi:RNA recognition motif-containing protein
MQNIFVENLGQNTSEQILKTAFEAFGKVLSVTIVADRDTGGSRGIAFVEMSSDEEAKAAINGLNGTVIDGQIVSLNEARPKEINGSGVRTHMRRHRQHRY